MKENKIITVQLRQQTISPKKGRLVINLIRGKSVSEALDICSNTRKKATIAIIALLKSALSGVKEKGVKEDEVFVCEALVNEGKKMKRYFIKARGRSTKFQKRSSHFKISLCKIEKTNQKKRKASNGKKS